MALTNYATGNALTVKAWAKKLYAEALKQTWFSRLTGTGSNSVIQMHDDLKKQAGDQITYGLRMQLTGDGTQGDATLEGNEEALTTYSDAVIINQIRHAVRSNGKMSEQRVAFNVRDESMKGLSDWWADRWDTSLFNHLCGNTVQTNTLFTGNNAVVAPDANHQLWGGSATTDQGLGSGDTFVLTLLDKAVARAKTLTPAIRPVRIDGEDYFVAILHPHQVYNLRTNTNAGQWLDIQKAAMAGMKSADSPIFTGMLGIYNQCILFESSRLTLGVHSTAGTAVASTRRAVFCGAQAASMAFGRGVGEGQKFGWQEEEFDYGNQLGVSAGSVFGIKKSRFNSADFANIVISTYAAAV